MMTDTANSHLIELIDALILLVIVLMLWGGHWFPWHVFPALVEPTGKRELKRLVAYTYGVGCIWLGALAYALTRQAAGLEPAVTIVELTQIILAAALGTVLPRLVKAVRDLQVDRSERKA